MPEAIEFSTEGMECIATFSSEEKLQKYLLDMEYLFSKVKVYGTVKFTQTRIVHPIRGIEYTVFGKSLLIKDQKALWIFLHGFNCGRAERMSNEDIPDS